MSVPRAAVVGDPVKHSLSPDIFAAFSVATGKPLEYTARRLTPDKLPAAFEEARRSPDVVGWSVTLPHKVGVMSLVSAVDESARGPGAVNAVDFRNGAAIGYNTDAGGFLAPLRRRGAALHGARAVVLGAGGAARAVCWGLRREGIGELTVLNRTPGKAEELAAAFGASAGTLDPGAAAAAVSTADLIVNATSAQTAGEDGKRLLPEEFVLKEGAWAYDLTYRPLETGFLAAARGAGARPIGGLEMLVAQAAAAWGIWFEESLPDAVVDRVQNEMARRLS